MLISLEGLDGSGKGTVLDAITERYGDVTVTSEPSDGEYGQLVRRNLSQDTDPIVDFYLFMADRMDHINSTIRPANHSTSLVVSDRYVDSTRAYQSVALAETDHFSSQFEAKDFIERTVHPWNIEPDLTIYLDISVDTAIERADGDEKYEDPEFLEKVRENYEAIVESDAFGHRIVRVDGEQSKEAVRKSALGKIDTVAPDRL